MISESSRKTYEESDTYKITVYNHDGKIVQEFDSAYIISRGNPIIWEDKNTGKEKYFEKGMLNSILIEEI